MMKVANASELILRHFFKGREDQKVLPVFCFDDWVIWLRGYAVIIHCKLDFPSNPWPFAFHLQTRNFHHPDVPTKKHSYFYTCFKERIILTNHTI